MSDLASFSSPSFPTIVTSRRIVPNLFPTTSDPNGRKIALIGEAPGENEEDFLQPFVGPSGNLLTNLLKDLGISRSSVYLGNVCQTRPPQNRIEAFPWEGEEIQSGLTQLKHDLNTFNPNICILLGGTPLHAGRGPDSKITSWRGSLFKGNILDSPFYSRKCVATLHPAFVLREFSGFPYLKFDLKRGRDESISPDLVLPVRELITHYDASTICHILDNWPAGLNCSVDIEGGLPVDRVHYNLFTPTERRHLGWRCVSLSSRPSSAFAIAWWKFSDFDHARILGSFARLMWRRDVPKVFQNGSYDTFCLSYGYDIHVRNFAHDTMLSGWEVFCELRKGLSTQASIWTREPHWKDDEMYESNGENLAIGCCRDTAVTIELHERHIQVLEPAQHQHYEANLQILRGPLRFMQEKGICYDKASVATQLKEAHTEISEVGESLNKSAGSELRGSGGSLSPTRLAKVLYTQKGYPPQYKKEAGRKTEKVTTDVEAILSLRKKSPQDQFLTNILRHRHLEGILETLSITPDADGRIRCGYNVVGTETGRLTCYTSPTGAGANLTTITKKLRKNYTADPGYDFFQCDLAGADGWTVAAHCAKHGDLVMIDDYEFGLKPAKILALLYQLGPSVNQLDRDSLKNACRTIESGSDIYEASKVMQHGTDYLMGIPTAQKHLMIKSFKISGTPIYFEHSALTRLQSYFHSRYVGVKAWQAWVEGQVRQVGKITAASGQTRILFGRRFGDNIHDTVKEALAHEPQANTTWATNLAMLRLWRDPGNRIAEIWKDRDAMLCCDGKVHHWPRHLHSAYNFRVGSLLIEPLHQVHDALCGQWPTFLRDWARAKVKSYFDNKLTIAGRSLVIPFEGGWGPSWGELPNPV